MISCSKTAADNDSQYGQFLHYFNTTAWWCWLISFTAKSAGPEHDVMGLGTVQIPVLTLSEVSSQAEMSAI